MLEAANYRRRFYAVGENPSARMTLSKKKKKKRGRKKRKSGIFVRFSSLARSSMRPRSWVGGGGETGGEARSRVPSPDRRFATKYPFLGAVNGVVNDATSLSFAGQRRGCHSLSPSLSRSRYHCSFIAGKLHALFDPRDDPTESKLYN